MHMVGKARAYLTRRNMGIVFRSGPDRNHYGPGGYQELSNRKQRRMRASMERKMKGKHHDNTQTET